MSRFRVHVFYAGRVQGVGFRYTVKSLVTGFEVTGTIRNLSDGRVELIAEGAKEELEAFQQGIQESGLGSLIDDEHACWSEARGDFCGFEIIR
ncbi:MAG: acylphosphatase [Verrucomicrobiota bacterium]